MWSVVSGGRVATSYGGPGYNILDDPAHGVGCPIPRQRRTGEIGERVAFCMMGPGIYQGGCLVAGLGLVAPVVAECVAIEANCQ